MKRWTPHEIARAAGARLLLADAVGGPDRAMTDSRGPGPGVLFVGLPGAKVDGGEYAAAALAAGAWGVLIAPERVQDAASIGSGAVLVAEHPLDALQRLAASGRGGVGARA